MKSTSILLRLFGLCVLSNTLTAQETRFFMPNEIRQAYDKGTRAYDGAPGPKYWQNTADYAINVMVDPKAQKLSGDETVTYYNNSPDELNTLVLSLYNDVFRKNSSREYAIDEDKVMNGVELNEMWINGEPLAIPDLERRRRWPNTLLRVPLQKTLQAGAPLTLRVRWTTQIPNTSIRAGVSDSTSFFIGYWYPQIAVYDDVFGWDELPYNLQSEFYNNLANFDVTITAPDNYLVWATGELQNAESVYPPTVLERFRKAHTDETPAMIVSADDLSAGYHNRSGTWHYKAREVSDFAFAISDHYLWQAAAQPVGDRKVLVNSIYPADRAMECDSLTAQQQKTMKAFSENMPGILYPYPVFTTFIGTIRGGMEFPMMANNSSPHIGFTVHEMFHTYFPMYVRINEKRWAWMDEGWARYGTSIVMQWHFQGNKEPIFCEDGVNLQDNTGALSDLPLITSTQYLDGSNYVYAAYLLPAFVYGMLHHHLGDEMFLKCLREYIRRWARKSPTPYDFFYTFENVSGEDLGWLWKPWFFEFGYPEVAIKSLKGNQLIIEKNGTRPTPLHVAVQYQNGNTKHVYDDVQAWYGKREFKITIEDPALVDMIQVNPDIPDNSEVDNFYPTLKAVYQKFKIPQDVAGVYRVQEVPIDVVLEWKDGLLFMRIPQRNYTSYLIPKSATLLKSLNRNIPIELQTSEGQVSGLTFPWFGRNLTAKR